MSTKRRSYTRFLSCLLALCLLLSIIPATAESPATPTELGPVIEEVQESGQPEVPGDPEVTGENEEAETTGDPEDPDGASGEDGLPSAEEADPVETGPDEAGPDEAGPDEADSVETEPVETDPYLATLKAGARLYADKDCYRKQQVLAEAAVVLVVRTEEKSSEVLYAYSDVEDRVVPGKAYARVADLTPLTEEETAGWQAAAHPEAVERRGFMLETVTFGTEEITEPETAGDEQAAAGEELAKASEEKAGEKPEEDLPGGDEEQKTAVVVENIGGIVWATTTDLSALSGASDVAPEELSGDAYVTSNLPNPRNQGNFGTCWAFSAIGAMEIYLVQTGSAEVSKIDLSELFLAYYLYHTFPYPKPGGEGDTVVSSDGTDPYLAVGGTNLLAIRIMENLIGTVAEETVPYSSAPKEPTKYEPIAAQLTGAYLVNVGSSNKEEIKKLIREHGAVGASIYMPSPDEYDKKANVKTDTGEYYIGYNSATCALYGTTTRANHDILLVGWDDDFSKMNFVSGLQPSGNGAWKVRNSWGNWGQGGYFWISYEDAALTGTEGTAYSAINANTAGEEIPDYCYSYNKIPDNDSYEASTAWVLKRPSPVTVTQSFTVDGIEKILSVGVETGTSNVTIGVAVMVDGDPASHTGSVIAKYKGFYRVKLDNPAVVVRPKQVTVSVTIRHAADGTQITVPYEPGNRSYSISSYNLTTHSGSGGFWINGETISNADSCIKLYTKRSAAVRPESVKIDGFGGVSEYTINNANSNGLTFGKTMTVPAWVSPEYNTDPDTVWESSDSSVLQITGSGYLNNNENHRYCDVKLLKNGRSRITVRSTANPGAVDTVNLVIDLITGVELNRSSCELIEGDSSQLTAKVLPADASNRSVTWTSSKPGVVTVDAGGNLRAVRAGKATVTATTAAGGMQAACTVTVLPKDSVEAFVTRLYRAWLLKEPKKSYVRKWVSRLDKEKQTAADLITELYDSAKLKSSKLTDEEFLKRAYQGILGRDPDAAGRDKWNSRLELGVSRKYVVAGLVKTSEFRKFCNKNDIKRGSVRTTEARDKDLDINAYIIRLYTELYGRRFDKKGLNKWCAELLDDPTREMAMDIALDGFIDSKEFRKRKLDDEGFIRVCYRTFCDREPKAKEVLKWLGKMIKGTTRDKVASSLAGSKKARTVMKKYGLE